MNGERAKPTIAQAWDKYRAMCVPAGAGEIQVRECKYAFYAGVSECLRTLLVIEAGPAGVDPTEEQLREGAAYLQSLHNEVELFAKNITRR